MSGTSWTLFNVGIAAVGVLLLRQLLKKPASAPLPPGPKPLPLIGNLLDFPTSHEGVKFAEWGQKYGDMVYITLFGKPMLILNSAKVASELLDKKSSIYSDRPTLWVAGETVGWRDALIFLCNTARFREYRRFLQRFMGTKAQVERFSPLQESQVHKFLGNVLQNPENVADHIRKSVGSVILKLSHGYDVQEGPDPLVHLADEAMHQFAFLTAPGAFMADVIPILRYVPAWFPGGGFRKHIEPCRKTLHDVTEEPYEFVKSRMRDNTNETNFTSELLENETLDDEKIHNIKWAAMSLYAGGADTTVSAIYSFYLAMVLYPDVQKRAQEELDSVIGDDRLPTHTDRPHLPYIEAIVSELLRWNPVAPVVPHYVFQEDFHRGYLIPAGTTVFANMWGMLHDPEVYPNPSKFDPTRYLPESGKTPAQNPREACFGFGRRICPGMHLADATLFTSCAMSLAAFHISKAVEDGKVIEPAARFTTGSVSHPEPFKCSIKPRSAKAEALILAVNEQK